MFYVINVIFIFLIFSIPILYRYIRVGKSSLIFYKGRLQEGENYRKAEFLRIIQILIGFVLLLFHSFFNFGLKYAIIFFLLCVFFSFIFELLGMTTGFFFGGYFKYNNKKNGPMLFGVPILILITWFGLIYMSLNYSIYFFNIKNVSSVDIYKIIKISFFSGFLIMCLDLVLDPIGVDEKRWMWEHPGKYYGVPLLNFFCWFLNCAIILMVFLLNSKNILFTSSSDIPVYLFSILPLIASRPCYERNLKFPAFFGLLYSFILIILLIV